MVAVTLRLVLARRPSDAESARELALPAVKVAIRDPRGEVEPVRTHAADRPVRDRGQAAVPAKGGFVILQEKSYFVRELLVLSLKYIVFTAQSLEQGLVVAATCDHQRGSLLFDLLFQFFDARQPLIGLALSRDEVVPHRSEVLLEGLDAQPQVLVFTDGTLRLPLHI